MALPAEFGTITIVRDYVDMDGAPGAGTVTFTPPNELLVSNVSMMAIVPKPKVGTIVAGHLEVVVPLTHDPDITPHFTFSVDENVSGLRRTYNIEIPNEMLPGPVNLGSLAPVGPVITGTTALTRTVADALYAPIDGVGLDEAALGEYLTTGGYATTANVTAATSGLVPTSRTIAGKPLSANVTLTAADVSAVPTARTVAGKALTADVTLVAADVSDSTTVGRSVVTAASTAAARTAIGAGTSNLALGTTNATAKAGDYQPAAANISDSTATGRSVLTATDAAAARTAIGAGTSNLALGTTSSTAKAGDYAPNAAAISDASAVGRSVLTSVDAAAARTAIGAGTSSLALGTTGSTAKAGDYQPTSANISDSTATGRSVLTAASAAAARTAIGAGTSSVAIGTTAGTAADAAAVTASLAGKSTTVAIGTAVTSQRIVIVPTAGEYTGGQAGDIVLVLSV